MKNYLELLKNIKENGCDHEDRTGTGRRSLFATQLRFNLQDGFPLVTTRKINLNAMIHETLWFLRGETNVNLLNEKGVHIWDKWTLREDDLPEIIKNRFNVEIDVDSEEYKAFIEEDAKVNTIGDLYGATWRNLPSIFNIDKIPQGFETPDYHVNPNVEEEIELAMIEIEKQLDDLEKEYVDENDDLDEKTVELIDTMGGFDNFRSNALVNARKRFLRNAWYGVVDQMANLIYNLKERPHSSRHVITSWIPELLPIESMSPKENVFFSLQALAPCHILQIYHVKPAIEEGGKKRLCLELTMRSSDVPIGLPYNIAQYALIQHLVAQTVGMDVDELVINGADSHIYLDQLDLVDEQLVREPLSLPTLVLNPEATVWNISSEDIRIEGYEPHGKIDYPVSV